MNVVFGGSFNPPTVAHLEIAKAICNKYTVEHFIFLPVGVNYSHKSNLVSDNHRLAMLELMAQDIPKAIISDVEMKDDYQGTYHTLEVLKKEYLDLVFILGADNLLQFDSWLHYQQLVTEYRFIVLSRGDVDVEKVINQRYDLYKDHFLILNIDYPISSSLFRENIIEYHNLVLPSVYKYILHNHLYQEEGECPEGR